MVDKSKINFDRKDYKNFFKHLINSKFSKDIKNWKDFENGRVNRTFYSKMNINGKK